MLSGNGRDYRQLSKPSIRKKCDIFIHAESQRWRDFLCYDITGKQDVYDRVMHTLETFVLYMRRNAIDSCINTLDYPINVMRAALLHYAGKPGPCIVSLLMLEHKYYSRVFQQHVVSDAVPLFSLVNNVLPLAYYGSYPVIIKPVKAFFSMNATVVNNQQDLCTFADRCVVSPLFSEVFNVLMKKFTYLTLDANYLIAEQFIVGKQTSVEGFLFDGKVTVLGIFDAIMYPGTISFERFEYPSSLPCRVQKCMTEIVTVVLEKSGLNNTLFSVECVYNEEKERVYIIEINPRISSQFSDLFEKVDGFNTYEVMVDLALGREPEIVTGKGKFCVAASFVLRMFEDKYVERMPRAKEIYSIIEQFPDACIELYANEGKFLSHEKQDGKSYRYAVINIGGADQEDLVRRFTACKKLLHFVFR